MSQPVSSAALPTETPLEPVADSELPRFTASLAKGEEPAWVAFHDRYRRRLLGYLARTWHGESAALDDLLQETLLRAVRHMRVFNSEDALWSWLTVLARSAVADHGRRRSRRGKFLQRWRIEAELRSIPAAPDEFARKLANALALLDEDTRALIEAKYYRAQSVRAIALQQSATEKAIEGRLARARRKLANLLVQSPAPDETRT